MFDFMAPFKGYIYGAAALLIAGLAAAGWYYKHEAEVASANLAASDAAYQSAVDALHNYAADIVARNQTIDNLEYGYEQARKNANIALEKIARSDIKKGLADNPDAVVDAINVGTASLFEQIRCATDHGCAYRAPDNPAARAAAP